MKEDQAAEREQRAWREAARFVHRDLIKFARDDRFAESFAQALPFYWNDLYSLETAEEMSMDEALRFFDWFAFDFELAEGRRLIDMYHEEKRADLSTHQQTTLDNWLEADPSSAYELISYEGQNLQLREYMTGEIYDAFEGSGRGNVEIGEVILTRLLPVKDRLEFSTTAAYLPADEITDLSEKMAAAKATDAESYPDATHAEFVRRHNHLFIHHALAEAEVQGRPPVARLNPNRQDHAAQKVVRSVKRLRR